MAGEDPRSYNGWELADAPGALPPGPPPSTPPALLAPARCLERSLPALAPPQQGRQEEDLEGLLPNFPSWRPHLALQSCDLVKGACWKPGLEHPSEFHVMWLFIIRSFHQNSEPGALWPAAAAPDQLISISRLRSP